MVAEHDQARRQLVETMTAVMADDLATDRLLERLRRYRALADGHSVPVTRDDIIDMASFALFAIRELVASVEPRGHSIV